MRILHVVPSYLPAVRYGGPIYSVHRLCVALAQQGHQVDVATTNVDGAGDSDVRLGERVDLDGVGVHYFASSWLRRLYYAPAMRGWLRSKISGYDVVHLHSVFLWPTLVAARAAQRARVPYVLSPRGMLIRELVKARSRWLKTAWIALFERRTVSRAAALHLTSKIEQKAFAEFGLTTGGSLEIVPNGVELHASTGSRSLTATPYVLVLGRISWKKRIDRVIEAVAGVTGLELVIAGGDDEGLLPKLRACALEFGVSDRVRFVGHVDGLVKEDLLRDALALVMTSRTENYGNVVLEAMAVGTPAVVVPQIGAADAVRDANAGWVIDDIIAALRAQLSSLVISPEMANEAGARGASWVKENASWPAIAGRMLEVYQRCLPMGKSE